MKELQQLIDYLKVEKSKALVESQGYGRIGDRENESYYDGKFAAFDLALMEAELLLKNSNESNTA